MKTYTTPTESSFFLNHSDEALAKIIAKQTADAAYMARTAPALAANAMAIANAAWEEQTRRNLVAAIK